MTRELFIALAGELGQHKSFLSLRSLSEGDRQRQGLALTNARYFITVLENHIMERAASVVFTIEMAEDCCTLGFCRPVTPKEYSRLDMPGYVPKLRSKVYLSVGLGRGGGVHYAYSAVKMSQYASLIDLFDALLILGKELEQFLNQL